MEMKMAEDTMQETVDRIKKTPVCHSALDAESIIEKTGFPLARE
jgi:hypothetical protein